jgi:hypothetical protein
MELPTVPCDTCGEPTTFTGTKRCNNCWEVERRIQDYARSAKGKKFLLHTLVALDAQELLVWLRHEKKMIENRAASGALSQIRLIEYITGTIKKQLKR